METKKFFIKGMHCEGCVYLLTEEFGKIKNVEKVEINLKSGIAALYYKKNKPELNEVRKIARKNGYDAFDEKPEEKENNKKEWFISFLISGTLLAFFYFLRNAGFLDSIDLSNSKVTYGFSFLTGVIASLSTCFAVVGSIVLLFNANSHSNPSKVFTKNILFHVGRMVTFFILGGLLGFIGGEVNISGHFVSIYTTIIALIMFVFGLKMLNIFPIFFGIKMPGMLQGFVKKLKEQDLKFTPFLLGSITFFLPCGFTQGMQIFALTSGSFLKGALSLFFYAFGTLPVLLIAGFTTSLFAGKNFKIVTKVAGILIIIFAIFTFSSGMSLFGVKLPVLSTKINSTSGEVSGKNPGEAQGENGQKNSQEEEQIVEMHITYQGFSPNVLKIKKGVKVKWIIYGDEVTGCTNAIVIPSLDISKPIKSGENIIYFTPEKTGIIDFSCWMGMVKGKFIVE